MLADQSMILTTSHLCSNPLGQTAVRYRYMPPSEAGTVLAQTGLESGYWMLRDGVGQHALEGHRRYVVVGNDSKVTEAGSNLSGTVSCATYMILRSIRLVPF